MKFPKPSTYSIRQLSTGAAALLITLLTLQSCKKDRPSNGSPAEKNMVISFASASIPFADVDSAVIVLKKQGSALSNYRRFDKTNGALTLVMDDTQSGNWTADISIYTKKRNDNSSRMYTRSVGFSLPLASNLNVAAPTGEIGGVWEPHIVLASDNNDVVAVISADNGEPYFDVRVTDSKWDYFYIERYAHNRVGGTNEQVAADAWECYTSCYTSDKLIVNTTGFLNFSNTVKTKNWNNGEIFIIIADMESQEERTFFYTYNK